MIKQTKLKIIYGDEIA